MEKPKILSKNLIIIQLSGMSLIFQEDELTLILAGGALGALAGWAQMWINKRADRRKLQAEKDAAVARQALDVDDWW